MLVTEIFLHTLHKNKSKISASERLILEAELFIRFYEELKGIFKSQYKDFFNLIKFNMEMEDAMIEENLLCYVINDMLATGEYTLNGIAYYTNIPEDVLHDIISGKITNPSSNLFRQIIKLHRSIRPSLYNTILKKIMSEVA